MTRPDREQPDNPHRRRLLRQSLIASGVLAVGPGLWGINTQASPRSARPLNLPRQSQQYPQPGRHLARGLGSQ